MKIAIINVTGTEGSTGKIATSLAKTYIEQGYTCRIYHGRGQKHSGDLYRKYGSYLDNVIHFVLQKITDKEGCYSTIYTNKIIKNIRLFKPDHIILLNLHGHYLNIPMFMNSLAQMRATVSYFMCDEFPYTARCTYAGNCNGYISGCDKCKERYKNIKEQYDMKMMYYNKIKERITFSSVGYLVSKAKESSLLKDMKIKNNNTGINTAFYHPVDAEEYRKKLGIDENKVVLIDVAPFSNKRKGLLFFLEAAKKLLDKNDFVFINVGYDGKEESLPPNYIALPFVKDQEELRTIYSLADAYICTSIDDALPNACVEAMSCGTPIIAFNISGMPYIAEYPVLTLAKEVTSDALVERIKNVGKKSEAIEKACREYAENNYSFAKYAKEMLPDS